MIPPLRLRNCLEKTTHYLRYFTGMLRSRIHKLLRGCGIGVSTKSRVVSVWLPGALLARRAHQAEEGGGYTLRRDQDTARIQGTGWSYDTRARP